RETKSLRPLWGRGSTVKMNIDTGSLRRFPGITRCSSAGVRPMNPPATQAPTPPTPGPDHGPDGRFTRGNNAASGNPFARKMAALRQAAVDSFTEEDIHEMIEAVKVKARKGDLSAVRLAMSYSAGKPQAPPDPDTLDAHELNTHLTNTTPHGAEHR